MVQILVQLDDELARQLDKVAPGRSRKRSQFIRLAIQKALMDMQESATRAAYLAQPDDEPAAFSPETWEPRRPAARRVRRK